MRGAGRSSGCVDRPSCVKALMVYEICWWKNVMLFKVQESVGLNLTPRIKIRVSSTCIQGWHLPWTSSSSVLFSSIIFCTERLEKKGTFGIGESTGDGLCLNPAWVSMCKVTSPCKSSCRSLAQHVTDGPLLTLNFRSSFAFPGLS